MLQSALGNLPELFICIFALRAGLVTEVVAHDDLLPTAVALAERAAGRDGALVRRTKASLDASMAASSADDALAVELAAQEWSMARPEFHATLEKLKRPRP